MQPLYVGTVHDGNRPLKCGVFRSPDYYKEVNIFAKGYGTTVHDALKRTDQIQSIILAAVNANIPIVTVDFKEQIKQYDLPYGTCIDYPVYDLARDSFKIEGLEQAIKAMAAIEPLYWHKLFANVGQVYHTFDLNGLVVGGLKQYPKWSQKTFTGRSKTSGINAHGFDESMQVTNSLGAENHCLIHFDWMAADVVVAAWLSQDDVLLDAFHTSDPYSRLEAEIGGLTRDEFKKVVLSAINSFHWSEQILCDFYPKLANWIRVMEAKIMAGETVKTVLGREYKLTEDRNAFAIINGILQGSIAHAMQSALLRTWQAYPNNILLETHDSITMSCPNDQELIQGIVDDVGKIMLDPFAGTPADCQLKFPTRISIGNQFKKYTDLKVLRACDA